MDDRYQVIVGNIGTVYNGNDMIEANRIYGEYKLLSQSGKGRAGYESVTLMEDGEPKFEHFNDGPICLDYDEHTGDWDTDN